MSGQRGMAIGNLTSQIFANIYLHELDRFVTHVLKPQAYLRYGDDFIVIDQNKERLYAIRKEIDLFLTTKLCLALNRKHDIIVSVQSGLRFLGVHIFPTGRRLNKRNQSRAIHRLNHKNISSYHGLLKQHAKIKQRKEFQWRLLQLFDGI